VPNRGRILGNELFYNIGECFCKYSLEYKTLPLHTADDIREAMIGAALTMKEASKPNSDISKSFVNWNVQALFNMNENREGCKGASHVTKAFVINKVSLLDMLKQQMFGYCAKKWSKENSGNKVFRTSFAEAYMLWRAMSHCKGDRACEKKLTLSEMCDNMWSSTEAAQADIDANLFIGESENAAVLEDIFHAVGGGHKIENYSFSEWSKGAWCTPAGAVFGVCEVGKQDAESANSTLEQIIASDPELGFRADLYYDLYYGPGGGSGDTTTKVGAMLSADGKTLYGLAEHRKDLWNTKSFRTCIYGHLRTVKNFEDGLERFDKHKNCQDALYNTLSVEYSSEPSMAKEQKSLGAVTHSVAASSLQMLLLLSTTAASW